MFGLGIWELGFIFLVVLLLFGAKSLPDIAKAMAKAFYAFKKEVADMSSETKSFSHSDKEKSSHEKNPSDN